MDNLKDSFTGYCVEHGPYAGEGCPQPHDKSICSCNPIDSYLSARTQLRSNLYRAIEHLDSNEDPRAISSLVDAGNFVQSIMRMRRLHFEVLSNGHVGIKESS